VFLSDVLPTAWQAVAYADPPAGGSLVVLGLGPIGDMCTRIALHRGLEKVIGVDLVPARLERARANGVEVVDLRAHQRHVGDVIRGLTGGRGADAVIDAVGMEAHGTASAGMAQKLAGLLPDAAARKVMETAGVDRLQALTQSIETVCRGGTISITGVYGGTADPINMRQLFDEGVKIAMGQAHVKRWIDDLMPLLCGDATRSVSKICAPTGCRWRKPRTAMRSCRKRRTAPSRSCCSPDRVPTAACR
jgi:threonine dehydrogenase-like Zn-dependent dehydrogenase